MASKNPFDGVTGSLGVTSLSQQLEELQAINDSLMQQQKAALQQSTASASGSSGGGSGIGSVLGSIGGFLGGGLLSGGLGIAPLISGIADLFGGGGSSTPPPITPYMAPLPIQLDAGFSAADGGAPFGVDSARGGSPRAMTSSSPQITVQVQAMDSQSFLDHSNDIAMAVRQAMTETTVLNDVIREV